MWTSPDAITWTPRNLPDAFFVTGGAESHTLLVWADDLGLFACVREDGSVVASSDGITWVIMTPSTDPDAQIIEDVCWAKRLGALVFTGLDDGFGSKPIHYSEDGLTIHTVDYAGPNSRAWALPAYSDAMDVLPVVRRFGYSVLLIEFGPEITAVVPGTGDVAGGETVEIQGGGFEVDTQVVFANHYGLDLVFNNEASLTCRVPGHPSGPELIDVVVTNSDGRFDIGVDFYEYIETDGGIPTIESGSIQCGAGSIVPNTGTMVGGTSVIINGAGFVTGSEVFFGDEEATSVVVTPTQITCVTPPHQLGSVDVTVITP